MTSPGMRPAAKDLPSKPCSDLTAAGQSDVCDADAESVAEGLGVAEAETEAETEADEVGVGGDPGSFEHMPLLQE